MKRILGRKQKISNQSWIDCLDHIEEYVTREEIEALTKSTADAIVSFVNGRRAAFGWSAGKDSLVLQKLCEMAGIKDCVLTVTNLEYPAFMEWVEKNKPSDLEIVNTGQDLEWLKKHQDMLFPQDSKTASRWFHIVQHRGQDKYFKEHDLEVMILGRRRADGNYVGKGADHYTTAKGITRYSPMAGWSHEEILAFIHYNQIELPPIYDWANGFYCGTHPWPARQWTESLENGWKEIFEIDQSIVIEAAEQIESARKFLDNQ